MIRWRKHTSFKPHESLWHEHVHAFLLRLRYRQKPENERERGNPWRASAQQQLVPILEQLEWRPRQVVQEHELRDEELRQPRPWKWWRGLRRRRTWQMQMWNALWKRSWVRVEVRLSKECDENKPCLSTKERKWDWGSEDYLDFTERESLAFYTKIFGPIMKHLMSNCARTI